jgi:hypothetical protein
LFYDKKNFKDLIIYGDNNTLESYEILEGFLKVKGRRSPPGFIYCPKTVHYIVLHFVHCGISNTTNTPKERRTGNTETQELFNDASKEVNDAAT